MNNKISVIIPTRGREALLRLCVESVLAQSLPAAEILVVDNGSGASDFGGAVRLLAEPKRGVSHARNLGIERSAGDVLAFIDDDAQADPDWLARLTQCLEETGAAGAGGPAVPRWQAPPPPRLKASTKTLSYLGAFSLGDSRRRLAGPRDFLIGTNCAFRRRVFEAGHRFKAPAWGRPDAFEDVEFSRRIAAAYPVYYEPAARVSHFIPARKLSLRHLAKTAFANGLQKAAYGGRLSPRGARDVWGVDGWLSAFSAAGFACGAARRALGTAG